MMNEEDPRSMLEAAEDVRQEHADKTENARAGTQAAAESKESMEPTDQETLHDDARYDCQDL